MKNKDVNIDHLDGTIIKMETEDRFRRLVQEPALFEQTMFAQQFMRCIHLSTRPRQRQWKNDDLLAVCETIQDPYPFAIGKAASTAGSFGKIIPVVEEGQPPDLRYGRVMVNKTISDMEDWFASL